MESFDLREPSDCKKYLYDLQEAMQECLGPEHRLFWIVDNRELLIDDLDEENLLKVALNLALKQPYIGGTQ